jgi:hypothetical protein
MIKDVKFRFLSLIIAFFFISVVFTGCDFSSMSDVKKAEKLLKKADDLNAEFWAEPEYKKAQKWLNIAIDFTHERKINEARDAAQEARDWATEAINLAIKRAQEMEEERDGIKKKDY